MIYLDNAATTRPCDAAVSAVSRMLTEGWANPSAAYREAIDVEKQVAKDREAILRQFDARLSLVFTGGGTEADSLAVLGGVSRRKNQSRVLLFSAEHPGVSKLQPKLEARGYGVCVIPSMEDGRVDLDAFEAAANGETCLASLMHVNNETGAVQPVAEAAAILKKKNPDALFHSDGVQAFMRMPFPAGVDFYSVSAHKIHGPKGVGALVLQNPKKLEAQIVGGGQESGLRAGTENTPGIAGFAAAVEWIASRQDCADYLRAMKLCFYHELLRRIDGLRVNGPDPESERSAPHILNVSVPGVRGEVMLHALEREGVLVGTGAACGARKVKVSHTLEAMRSPAWAAENAIRVSFGLMNTQEEAREAAEAVWRCFERYCVGRR